MDNSVQENEFEAGLENLLSSIAKNVDVIMVLSLSPRSPLGFAHVSWTF